MPASPPSAPLPGRAPVCAEIPGTRCETWVSGYDHPPGHADRGFDLTSDAVLSPDGNLLFVTGSSWDAGSGYDLATMATDPESGAVVWESRLGGAWSEAAYDLEISPDGSRLFVTGLTNGGGDDGYVDTTESTYLTAALDAADGSVLWTREYTEGLRSIALSVAVSPDGETLFVTGIATVDTGTYSAAATIAYDAATGTERWVRLHPGEEQPPIRLESLAVWGQALHVSRDGELVLVATGRVEFTCDWTCDLAPEGYDIEILALRTDTGEEAWRSPYPGLGDAFPVGLHGGVTGERVFATGVDESSHVTLALEPDTGHIGWSARRPMAVGGLEGFEGRDYGMAVTVSPDEERLYVATSVEGDVPRDGSIHFEVSAFDTATGALLWRSELPTGSVRDAPPWDVVTGITTDPPGDHVYVTGYRENVHAWFTQDYLTSGLDAQTGATLWTARYSTTGIPMDQNYPTRIVATDAQVLVVGDFGYATDANSGADMTAGEENWWDYGVVAYRA